MNIAVDIQPLCTESAQRGMGVYTQNLLEEMFRLDSENQYFLFNIYGDCCFDGKDLPKNVHYLKLYPGKERYLIDYAISKDGVGMRYEGIVEGLFQTFIRENSIDLFFLTSPFDMYMVYNKTWFRGARVACIFYDLVPWLFPDRYLKDDASRMRYKSVLDFVVSADLLLAISNSAKNDIVEFMNMPPERVQVIHAGVSSGFAITEFSEEQKREVFAKYGLDSEYMLFPSGDDFRKNALKTVQAYALLPKQTQNVCQLVITGKSPADEMPEIKKILKENNIENRVIFSGHIPYEDLLLLYNCSKLVLFASLYEGFGLPVIEAFKCGKNVVTSDNSSLGEVARDAAVLVDPRDSQNITNGILQALDIKDFSAFDAVKKERIAFYTWENSARLSLEGINALPKLEQAVPKQLKIAYFSPLPPIKSRAAKDGDALLQKLEELGVVDIFVDGGYHADRYIRVLNHVAFPKSAKNYDIVLFNLHNDESCLYMLPHISGYGGMVIMNDADMHSAVLEACKKGKLSWSFYERMIHEEVGESTLFVREVRRNEKFARAAVENVDLNRAFLDRAFGVLVKDGAMRERMLEKNIGYNIEIWDGSAKGLIDFALSGRKKYLDDVDLMHICDFEIPARKADFESEIEQIANTLGYVARGGKA